MIGLKLDVVMKGRADRFVERLAILKVEERGAHSAELRRIHELVVAARQTEGEYEGG